MHVLRQNLKTVTTALESKNNHRGKDEENPKQSKVCDALAVEAVERQSDPDYAAGEQRADDTRVDWFLALAEEVEASEHAALSDNL